MSKTVLLGITGCVAAYKSCEIVRLLQKAGLRVKVVMTKHATEFVTPYQFRALTREPVAVGLFDDAPGDPIHHISLAQEADLFLIAPCTANVIAKLANGIADDLLTTTALAARAPLAIAPAMNVAMYEAAATQENLARLRERGVAIIDAEEGYLACGDVGKGRLADPSDIVRLVTEMLGVKRDLEGRTVLITTGPTREYIDPVRFITNPSSGKTGFALAQAAHERGAHVVLVTGPVELDDIEGVKTVRVTSAQDMFNAVDACFAECDIAIFSAAVCDMRPASPSARKLKKGVDDDALKRIDLVKNPDILATMGARKASNQVVIGYAAETEDVEANARAKLLAKHADAIVGNLAGGGRAFGTDDNEVIIVTADNTTHIQQSSKESIAHRVLDAALALAG